MPLDTSGHQLRRSLSWSVILAAVGAAIGFASQTALARTFGADVFGRSVYAMGWVNLLQVWGTLGLVSTVVRFAPAYRLRADGAELQQLMRFSYAVIAGVALVLFAVVQGLRHGPQLLPLSATALLLVHLLVVTTAGLELNASALAYTGHAIGSQLIQGVLRPAATLVLAVLWPFMLPRGPDAALLVVASAVCLAFGVSVVACTRAFGLHHAIAIGTRAQWKGWLHYAMPSIVSATAISLISTQLDTIVVGTMLTPTDAGVYAVGASLASLVHLAPQAVERVLAPRLNAAIDLRSREEQVDRLADLVTANLVITVLSCVGVLIIAKPLLLLFGKDFSRAAGVSATLAVGVVFQRGASVGPSTVLHATGFQQRVAIINIVVAGFAAVASIVMTGAFGILGTALATVASGGVRSLALMVAQKRSVTLNMTRQDMMASLGRIRGQLRVVLG